MRKLTLLLSAAAVILYACNSEKKDEKTEGVKTETTGKETKDPCAGYTPDTANQQPMDTAMMNMMMAAATPGDMHKMLASADGEWEGEVTYWTDPAAPPTTSKSTATNRMIFGGRYQLSDHVGCMMGMPFEGMSLVGYDNMKKVFVTNWIDNMGTMMMHLEGPYDPVTKTIKLSGTCTNPMDGSQMNMREEFIMESNDLQRMIMYGPDMKGKEYKSMEIVYKRKK